MRAAAAALLLLLLSVVASLAQSPVSVIGAVTPGHCVNFFSTTQIQDAGATCGGGGGGGTPGGGFSQLQYNNAGAFGGIAGSSTDGTLTAFISGDLALLGTSSGQTTLALASPTGNFTITFPATTDTLAVLGTPQTFTAPQNFAITQTIASATAANWRNIFGAGATTTITGNTGSPITALYAAEIAQPTLTDASAVTVTNSATLFIAGAPIAAGSVTITNAWAIRVGAGNVSFPGSANALGTITSGTWNGSLIGLSFGGTNNALTASAGGIVWSDASKLNILAGTSTAGLCLLSGNLVTPAWTACPGATPGGANTNVQFNNSGAFGGDAGFTYAGNGQATLALGTITTNLTALNMTGTWNAAGTTFDAPLEINITNTASAAASALFDFAVGGTSLLILQPNTNPRLSLGNGATPSVFRAYNTVDTLSNPTNYERGMFDWTTNANSLTIGTQKGGTGSSRNMQITATGSIFFNAGGSSNQFNVTATALNIAAATVTFGDTSLTLANGLNSNTSSNLPRHKIVGPSGAFSIGGFSLTGSNPPAGAMLWLHNTTAQAMTIVNEDVSSTANFRITTLTGANVVLAASVSEVKLNYDSVTSRWILQYARDSAGIH